MPKASTRMGHSMDVQVRVPVILNKNTEYVHEYDNISIKWLEIKVQSCFSK